ncbi:hypothetical protein T484DRAFT_1867776 [Baffinella frigidus]|nr:hypothetical protein T484DRAFT_1867776 [Cryptophyta sp. CCMP2293]
MPNTRSAGFRSGLIEVAKYGDSDVVVTGIVGCAGLLPTVAAIEAGKVRGAAADRRSF